MSIRAVVCCLFVMALAQSTMADVEVLESIDLRLEVTTGETYDYRLLERSTGQVLIIQNLTELTVGGSVHAVTGAGGAVRTDNSLQLGLSLAVSSDAATVLFTFVRPDTLQVELSHDPSTATTIREQFADQQEHYYGLFEYPFRGALDNRGLDRDMIGYGSAPGTNFANARAPFYFTTQSYGIYVDSAALGHYTIAVNGSTSFAFNEPALTYYVIHGNPAEIMQVYNDLAGGTYMPPDWAFSTIWWRNDHHEDLGFLPDAQSRVIEDARRLQQLAIPAGAIWIDRPYTTGSWGWGGLDALHDRIVFDDQGTTGGNGFPDPAGMIAEANSRGLELMVWIANRHEHEMRSEALARDYVFPGWESKSRPAIDLSKPDAFAWFADRLTSLADIGIRGYKIDRGHEGEMPTWAENRNVLLCHQMAAQTMGLSPAGPNSSFIFARNLYDRSRRYCAVWNGDTKADWTGLEMSIKNLLRCANINFPVWGSDTGGYSGAAPTKELFARWLGFSAYSPTMEILIGPSRTIWDDYDEELIDIARTHCRTHHELLPYLRSCMYRAQQTGRPVARPLVFDFPDDPNLVELGDEYLLGDAFLVAPIHQQGATNRSLYIPATSETWLDFNDLATIHTGGETVILNASLSQVPVLLRSGQILVRGNVLQVNQQGLDWGGPSWAGPRLRVEAFLTTDDSFSAFDYYSGNATPVVSSLSLNRSSGRIDLDLDWQALPQPLACRFFVDALTAEAFTTGALSVYVNDLLADSVFRADPDLLELNGTIMRSPADLDGDYDVDSEDFVLFEACVSGPGLALEPGCESRDCDGDNDVDQSDFGIFQRCYSGENNLADSRFVP